MPGMDKTGPNGAGPMTGGARGYCSGNFQGARNPSGYGYGRGGGFRRRFFNRNNNFQNPLPNFQNGSEVEE
ncbi:MAG: DUF5320 domain-containing protein [Desulforegulaceae bacterium]|nr:DUF5320 domain-containing protein [Desulforegulaceae bacterium]